MAASSSASVVGSWDASKGGQTVFHQGEMVLVDRTGLSAKRTILRLDGSTSASAGVVSHSRGRIQYCVGTMPPAGWQVHPIPKKSRGR